MGKNLEDINEGRFVNMLPSDDDITKEVLITYHQKSRVPEPRFTLFNDVSRATGPFFLNLPALQFMRSEILIGLF